MAAPLPPRNRSYRTDGIGVSPIPPSEAPLPPQAELTNAEPQGVGQHIGAFLDTISDGPVSTFLAQAVKGAVGSPLAHLAVQTNPLLRMTGMTDDFDDFLTTVSAKQPGRLGSDMGRLVGAAVPELLAYTVASTAGAELGAAGVRTAARTTATDAYFRALNNPFVAGQVKPAIVRAGEILGTAVANGGLAGAEDAATNGPDPLRTALEMGALSAGLEGGVTLGAKLLSRGARETSKQKIAQVWAGSDARKYLQDTETGFRQKLIAQSERVGKAVDEHIIEQQMQGMVPALPMTARQAVSYARAQATGIGEATAKRVNAIRKLHQASGSLQAARRFAQVGEREILAGAYLSERPTNFDSTLGSLRKAFRSVAATPDSIRKEIGVAGEYGLRSLDNATLLGFGRGNASVDELVKIHKNVTSLVGKRLAGEVLLDLEEGAVSTKLAARGFTPHQISQVEKQLDLLTGGSDALHEIAVRMGGEPALALEPMGIPAGGRHIPHNWARGAMGDEAFAASMEKHLVKKGFTREEATRRALDVIEAQKARGYARFGSADERRLVPGTLREKIANGLPVEPNPWKAYARYFVGMHQRIALSNVLGWKNEMLPKLVHAVRQEAGPGAAGLFRSNVEAVAGLKYYNRLQEAFARNITNLEVAAKMGFSFIPNAYQPGLNNPIVYGLKNTFKGIASMAAQHAPRDLQQALGFMASDYFDLGLRGHMMQDFGERGITGLTSKLARATLRGTPFNFEERFNRGSSAFGAHAVLTDILAKSSTGRLRGTNLTFARKVFEEAGMDLGQVLRDGLSQEQYITGTLRLMRRTQFAAGEGTRMIRPTAWNHPLGRVMFQFNTFTLNQARLLRDFVLNEIARGNPKQLSRFLGVYLPMAEVSVATQDAVREAMTGDKPRERATSPIVRAIEDMVYAGSFGMANTMFWAAKGGKMEKMFGPTITDLFTYGEALAGGRYAEVGRRLSGLPSVRYFSALGQVAYRGGDMLRSAAQKYLDAADADDPDAEQPGGAALTLKDFRGDAAPQAAPRTRNRSYR